MRCIHVIDSSHARLHAPRQSSCFPFFFARSTQTRTTNCEFREERVGVNARTLCWCSHSFPFGSAPCGLLLWSVVTVISRCCLCSCLAFRLWCAAGRGFDGVDLHF